MEDDDSFSNRISQKSKRMPLYPVGMFVLIVFINLQRPK